MKMIPLEIGTPAPRASAETGLGSSSIPGGKDSSKVTPPSPENQAKNAALERARHSMRALFLRESLIREILRAGVIGMEVQAALLDGDDREALTILRGMWGAFHGELQALATKLARHVEGES
jgi:hypothetical protein